MILEVLNVSFRYKSVKALSNIKFKAEAGKVTILLGPNGAGKTTLLKCIAGLLEPEDGVVLVSGLRVHDLKPKAKARLLGYLQQNPKPSRTLVYEAVLAGRKPYFNWKATGRDYAEATRALRTLGLDKLSSRRLDELSGGELQKTMIARLIAQNPKVMLLDEPTSNLDPRNQVEILSIIRRIVRSRSIVCIASMHDINLALWFGDYFIIIKNGVIIAAGGRDVVTEDVLREAYGIDFEIKTISNRMVALPRIESWIL